MTRLSRLVESLRPWVPLWVSLLFEKMHINDINLMPIVWQSQPIRADLAGKEPNRTPQLGCPLNSHFKSFLWFLFQHFVRLFNRTAELSIELALTLLVFSIWSISYATKPPESFESWSRISIRAIISIIQIIRCRSFNYSSTCFWSFYRNIFGDFWRFQGIFDITINASFEVLFEVKGLIEPDRIGEIQWFRILRTNDLYRPGTKWFQ